MTNSRAGLLTVAAIGAFLLASVGTSLAHSAGSARATAPAANPATLPSGAIAPTVTSNDLAGYIVTSASGSATNVQANWHVPQIAAACPSILTAASFFVGFNAQGTSTTVDVGTQTDCVSGAASYAGFIMLGTTTIGLSLTISPADNMFGQVKFKSNTFTLTLKDLTTGKSYSKIVKSSAARYSAEWFAADPHKYPTLLYPLTDFGWVTFRNASATIGGHTHSIGGFFPAGFTMWNVAGTKVKVSLGSLTNSGSQFVATWKSRGP